MLKEITAFGKDVAEAKENARAALGAGPLDDVQFEVLDLGSKGIFGIIGARKAQVRAFIETPDKAERPERPRRERSEKRENRSERAQRQPQGDKKPAERQRKQRPEATEKKEAPHTEKQKSAVIPEAELKLTPRTVAPGEDMSYEFVKTVITDLGLDAQIELYFCEDGTRRITIVGADASALIGHHGDTLDALQYLANLACAQKNVNGEKDKSRVTIDIEGYRAKREQTLRALARRMAAKALRQKRSVMLEPMTPYERRIIHSEVQGIEGVCTNSVGSDNNRKIVIYLTDKKPKEIFPEEQAPATPIAEEFPPEEVKPALCNIQAPVEEGEEERPAFTRVMTADEEDAEESEAQAPKADDGDADA